MSDSGGVSQQQEYPPATEKDESQSQQVCTFFKKPSKAKNIRKRRLDADEEVEDSKSGSSVLNNLKKVAKPDSKLFVSSAGPSRSSATTSEAPERPVFHYDSSKEIRVQNHSRGTASLETESDFNQDARAIRERVLKRADEALKVKKNKASDEKLYTGSLESMDILITKLGLEESKPSPARKLEAHTVH